jgi:hypothetical protein
MSESLESMPSGARESRAFFAALLAACRSDCDCETCQILRNVADSMTKEFVGEAKKGVKAKRTG